MKCAKVRYRTEIDAKIALSRAETTGARRSDEKRKEARAYRCPRCNGWHLTSQARRKADG